MFLTMHANVVCAVTFLHDPLVHYFGIIKLVFLAWSYTRLLLPSVLGYPITYRVSCGNSAAVELHISRYSDQNIHCTWV